MKREGILFDKYASERARDRAIQAVDAGVDPDDRDAVWSSLLQVIERGGEFTTDAVWEIVPSQVWRNVEQRVLGAAMRRAASLGLIESTGRYVKSAMVRCHSRPKLVWKTTTERV